jgi:hypothetical protein
MDVIGQAGVAVMLWARVREVIGSNLGRGAGYFYPDFSSFSSVTPGKFQSQDSAVGIATGYGLDDIAVGFRVPVGSRIFFSSRRPDWLWVPPNLLYNGTRGSFRGGKAAGA